ncbi:MAG: Transcription antitermination protein RfaH [Verrucomicrobia subdivision 3 bacterium]|nr:Transcription antitermination protein RfaH [Limisphaerales bacterium]MCS1413634.1 Transcription antitermination protein RfaH [Limisphaerales bacterium]
MEETEASSSLTGEHLWCVAHTRPRCEKKLVQYAQREGFHTTLPCIDSVHKYRGKLVTFQKPLFPNYVFLQLLKHQRQKICQSNYVANLLDVPDQGEFQDQLKDILAAVEAEVDIRLAPQITIGTKVIIKGGPLSGLEGWVEKREGICTVLLRLDFIGQAAAVKVNANDLELI